MSRKRKLRENKRCENCGHFVDKRFCPECGQENVETRQSFFHLIKHFVEDFVHYDGKFWKTIWYLLFFPAKLTKEYMAGKRNNYVNPIKLFIFISFFTFFLPAILPESGEKAEANQKVATENNIINPDKSPNIEIGKYKIDQIDPYKITEKFLLYFPKAIFLYMPIFAFWLWLFHNKKKRFYFDHGIYTLHYFSFILLSILLYILTKWLLSLFHLEIYPLVGIAMTGYFIYYFFHSHRLFYQEDKAVSRLKCSILFIVNTICMIVFLLLYVIWVMIIVTDMNLTEIFPEIIRKVKS